VRARSAPSVTGRKKPMMMALPGWLVDQASKAGKPSSKRSEQTVLLLLSSSEGRGITGEPMHTQTHS
jgi:hypothetical protein